MENKRKLSIITLVSELIDSSDDENVFILGSYKNRKKRKCIRKYVENTALLHNPDDFKNHFRMDRETFTNLIDMLGGILYRKTQSGRHKESPEKQLLIALTLLCNQDVFRNISEKFDISKSTAHVYLHTICGELVKLADHYIKWPTSKQQIFQTTETFKQRHGFINVIGAVDGSHIPIAAPKFNHSAYYNRKKYYSVILQGVCNAEYMFTDVCAGYPGSMHDACVLRKSKLGKNMEEHPQELFPFNTHILGDSAYPNTIYILTPFRDNGHLTRVQKNYNFKHSGTRVYIEQTFGILKTRFRILKYVNIYNTELIAPLIVACCVLHNICISRGDTTEPDLEDEDNADNTEFTGNIHVDVKKRNMIADKLFR